MAFWTDASFEPKRQFRWQISFVYGGQATAIEPFYAKKVTKPKLTMTTGEHKFLDRSFKFPGHVNWEDINVIFVDDTGNNVLTRLVGAFGVSNYLDIGGAPLAKDKKLKTISKGKMSSTLSPNNGVPPPEGPVYIEIKQLNTEGDAIETWRLYNPFIKELTPGAELDYEGDNLVEYAIILSYDWADVSGENLPGFQRQE